VRLAGPFVRELTRIRRGHQGARHDDHGPLAAREARVRRRARPGGRPRPGRERAVRRYRAEPVPPLGQLSLRAGRAKLAALRRRGDAESRGGRCPPRTPRACPEPEAGGRSPPAGGGQSSPTTRVKIALFDRDRLGLVSADERTILDVTELVPWYDP